MIQRVVFIFFIAFSWQQRGGNHKESIDAPKSVGCSAIQQREALIQSVIDLPKLQKYYEVQENIDQDFLVIKTYAFIDSTIRLKKFGLPVKILSKQEIENKKIQAYIEFKKVNIGRDSATVHMKYPLHGVGLKASFEFKDEGCNWLLLSSSLWEY